MEKYQQRVVKEKEKLDAKLDKLEEFLMNTDLPQKDTLFLLQTQYSIMDAYSRILEMRINNF